MRIRILSTIFYYGIVLLSVSYGETVTNPTTHYPSSYYLRLVEHYFNNLTTLKATFVQDNNDATESRGTFFLARPGRLRFSYHMPQKLTMIANQDRLYKYDPALDARWYGSLEGVAAAFLLKSQISFQDPAVEVKEIIPSLDGSTVLIDLIVQQQYALGLEFKLQPVQLYRIRTMDMDGSPIVVTLNVNSVNEAIDERLFHIP